VGESLTYLSEPYDCIAHHVLRTIAPALNYCYAAA
jgi:hypothetical protein